MMDTDDSTPRRAQSRKYLRADVPDLPRMNSLQDFRMTKVNEGRSDEQRTDSRMTLDSGKSASYWRVGGILADV